MPHILLKLTLCIQEVILSYNIINNNNKYLYSAFIWNNWKRFVTYIYSAANESWSNDHNQQPWNISSISFRNSEMDAPKFTENLEEVQTISLVLVMIILLQRY